MSKQQPPNIEDQEYKRLARGLAILIVSAIILNLNLHTSILISIFLGLVISCIIMILAYESKAVIIFIGKLLAGLGLIVSKSGKYLVEPVVYLLIKIVQLIINILIFIPSGLDSKNLLNRTNLKFDQIYNNFWLKEHGSSIYIAFLFSFIFGVIGVLFEIMSTQSTAPLTLPIYLINTYISFIFICTFLHSTDYRGISGKGI